ncbi:hypothetical protein MPSD_40690 [Mycobacterium pseudoshottsii JCM 15466]|nr:hypothetical protein MPSD_40690 [Mycobacterium pseudoshottsii JCM 15466]
MAATDLQHALTTQISLGRRPVIQVDVASVRLVGRLQWQVHRRIFLVSPVDEHKLIGTEPTGHKRIPVFPNFLVDPGVCDAGDDTVGTT